MDRVYGLSLDFYDTNKISTKINFKQYDYGTSFIAIQLLYKNSPINILDDTVFAVFKNSKGSFIYNKHNKILKSFAYVDDFENGVILIPLPNEVLETVGASYCEIVIISNDGSKRLTSPTFNFSIVDSIADLQETEPPSELKAICGRFLCGELKSSENVEVFRLNDDGSYSPTNWKDNVTPVNAKNLNKIELALQDLSDKVINLNSVDISYTTTADNEILTVKDALDKLLYSPLTISLNANVGTLHEKGSVINSINFTWSYNKKILSQMFDDNVLNISSRNYLYSTLTNNKTFTLRANDGKSDFTKSLSFSFIYPIYIGSIDGNITIPSENNIKQMTKRLVTPSSQSFSYTVNNKRMCICVPNNWTINSIIDPNNFNITSSFKQSNININCLDGTIQSYKLYLSEPTSQTTFTVKFNT